MGRIVTWKEETVCRVVLLAILAVGSVAGQEAIKKVSRSEAMQAATTKVQPEYPTIARQFKVEGTVELEAVVAENGTVEKVNILSGNAMLTRPAADTLKRWKFTPFTEDGKPVKVLAPITFTFKL
jgi:protein TonB